MKKLGVFLIVICLLFATACSAESDKKEIKKETLTNYYSENEIVLPKESKEFLSILSVAEREDGNLEIVVATKKESGILYIYDRKKEEWEKKGRISEQFAEKDLIMNANYIGGGEYFVEYFEDNSDVIQFAFVSKDKEIREFPAKTPSEFNEQSIGFTYFAYSEAGLICKTSNGDGRYYLLDNETGEILQDYNKRGTRTSGEAFVLNDNLVIVSEDNIETINIKSGELVDTDENMRNFLMSQIYSVFCVDGTNENIYRINSEGIERYLIADNKKEDLMKSYASTYSQEGVALYGVILCSNNNIVTYQVKDNTNWSITEFVYSDQGKEAKITTVKLYMLYQDAISDFLFSEFEQAYPEIHIEVQYGIARNNDTLTVEDAIKILNTELAAGKGPDIILMDNLSLESYVDSNLLADMSSIVEKVDSSQKYFNNILRAHETDGKIYSIPLAFELEGIQGEESIIAASDTLEHLTKELASLDKLEPDRMTLSRMMYNGSMQTLFYTYFDSCFNKEGKLEKGKVGEFFGNIQTIRNLSDYDISEKEEPLAIKDSLQYVPNTSMSISTQLLYTILSNSKVSLGKINNAETLQMMQGLKKDKEINWGLLKTDGASKFIPRFQFSVLEESSHKEEAFKFIEYVLNDGQISIQKWNVAFPVKKDIFEEVLQTEIESMKIAFGEVTEEEMTEVRYSVFTEEEINNFFKEIDNCIPISITNTVIYDMVIQSCTEYINNEILLEDAVNETVSKIKLIMEE